MTTMLLAAADEIQSPASELSIDLPSDPLDALLDQPPASDPLSDKTPPCLQTEGVGETDAAPADCCHSGIVADCPSCEATKPAIDRPLPDELPSAEPPDVDPIDHKSWEAEQHFRHRMRLASDAVASAALEKLHTETAYKLAKKRFDSAVDGLNEIANRGPEHLPLFDGPETPQPDPATVERAIDDFNAGRSRSPGEIVAELESQATADSWRAAYIEVLNLPTSLADKLAEAGIATMGQLEDLRAEIGLGHAKWPKGIGAAKQTLVEDRIVAWLTENRDKAVFASAAGDVPASEVPAVESPEPCCDPSSVDDTCPDDCPRSIDSNEGTAIKTTRENTPANLRLREREIMGDRPSDVSVRDYLHTVRDIGAWHSGRDAFNAGHDLTDCPYIAGDAQDAWLKGWMYQNGMGKGATDQGDDEAAQSNGKAKAKRKRAKKTEVVSDSI